MNLGHPLQGLSPTIDTSLLVALAGSQEPRSGRQLATSINRSPTGVRHVLERLVREGLVERSTAGRASLYTFNHDHLLASIVQEMANIRLELVERLRGSIDGWERPPVHASLFGSAARGDGDAESDIDLFLVRPAGIEEDQLEWRDQVERLEDSVERWTGNAAGIVEVPESGLADLRRRRPAIVDELVNDAIDLGGDPLRKVVAGR